jgi:hypothetical protein
MIESRVWFRDVRADLALKEQALARTAPPAIGRRRYQPTDTVLAFLQAL